MQRKCDHAKTLSNRTVLCIDENKKSLQLSPPNARWGSYEMEQLTHAIARLK